MLAVASRTPFSLDTAVSAQRARELTLERRVLHVVRRRVFVRELVDDVGAVTVGVVDLDEVVPLIRQRILGENRLDRAFRFACPAIYALLRINDQDPLELVDAVDGADIDAREVFDVDAGLGDYVCHRPVSVLRRLAPRRGPW